jgi:hypothetical protein
MDGGARAGDRAARPAPTMQRTHVSKTICGRMLWRYTLNACAAACAALVPSASLADAPPPAGYVERCKLENAAAAEEECILREKERSLNPTGRDVLAAHGFCLRCVTAGGTFRAAIYCRSRADASALPADWQRRLEAEPNNADVAVPAASAIARCSTRETTSGVETPNPRACGSCNVGAGEPKASLPLAALMCVLFLRRGVRRKNP